MKHRITRLLVPVLLAAGTVCTHRVKQPSTPEQTTTHMAGWPTTIEGVVLRDGRVIELRPAFYLQSVLLRFRVTVEGDSLILKRALPRRGVVVDTVSVDTVRIADVSHVIVRKTHVGRTVAAVLISVIAVGAFVGVLVLASSCPFIYVYDGSAYVAAAEPLGGAISRGLQRTDLSQLETARLVDGKYHLIIANEMREVQYLDAFSLVAADHPEGTTVIADHAGNLYVTAATVAPLRAVSASGEDLRPALQAHDQQWWSPGSSPAPFERGQLRDTITLSFPRPAHSSARLVLHARTSQLGAHSLKVMLDLWGGEVDRWYALLDGSRAGRAAHEEWVQREELWVLRVWLREPTGWVAQNLAVGGGPYLSELQAVPLDLSRVDGGIVELRLHPPRGYWDIDFAALDTAQGAPPRIAELHITEADALEGQDSRALLRSADAAYLVMPKTGQQIRVTVTAQPPAPGTTRTLFSRTTGYYEVETNRTGTRQAARLDSLWLQPGYGVKLAEQLLLSTRHRPVH